MKINQPVLSSQFPIPIPTRIVLGFMSVFGCFCFPTTKKFINLCKISRFSRLVVAIWFLLRVVNCSAMYRAVYLWDTFKRPHSHPAQIQLQLVAVVDDVDIVSVFFLFVCRGTEIVALISWQFTRYLVFVFG